MGCEMARNYTWLEAIPYLAALISCAPLIVGGFPQGHDWAFELARVAEFSHALDEGQFPPHCAPKLARKTAAGLRQSCINVQRRTPTIRDIITAPVIAALAGQSSRFWCTA